MITNYFKIAVRKILRHKVYSIINIAGLSVGMACTILILMWVQYEFSFDSFHEKKDRICRLEMKWEWDAGKNRVRFPFAQHAAGPALVREYPEAVQSVRFRHSWQRPLVQYKDKQFHETNLIFAENSVFDIFTFPMIKGDPKSALNRPFSIVITENMAKKYFGDEDPIGKVLTINFQRMTDVFEKFKNNLDFNVTGVMNNVPDNSHIKFNMLISMESLYHFSQKQWDQWWGDTNVYTYLLLQKNVDVKKLENKLPALIDKYVGEDLKAAGGKIEFFLRPLTSIYLHSRTRYEFSGSGDVLIVYAFVVIAVCIMSIAGINFMNLSTARSANRAKEVGIRKLLGAYRKNLANQFLGESFLFSLLSLLIALCLVEVLLPTFRSMTGSDLSHNYLTQPWFISGLLGIVIVVGFAAGSYPALFLSSFQPVNILKGRLRAGTASARFRSLLVVFQFSISIALIIGMSIILKQLHYIEHKKLGFDKEHVVTLPFAGNAIHNSLDAITQELKAHPGIINVCVSSVPASPWTPHRDAFLPEGFELSQVQIMFQKSIDPDFIPTMGMKIIAGRNFSRDRPTDSSDAILINETAAKQFGWDDPLGKTIHELGKNRTKTVIGVVRDFHFASLHHKIQPIYIEYDPSQFRYVSAKIKPDNISETLEFIKSKLREFDPKQTFRSWLIDEDFDYSYTPEKKLFETISYFTFLAIFISCLGLAGLASFASEQRTKEIGIRKAMGASVKGIALLLSKEFTKCVLIANIIAWPMAYFVFNNWLEDYAYRTNISLWIFLLAAMSTLLIALLTVSYQAIKAARANPIEALRYE
ncbi:MAG: ABC transporter permease [Desulfobacterales bacterium]|jgi:putative ABC transport system permease protein